MSTPHFSFPFRIEGGSASVVEQDDPEELEQNVFVLLLTEEGERMEVPDFGVPDPTFRTGIDAEAISAIAERWDERVQVWAGGTIRNMIETLRVRVEER